LSAIEREGPSAYHTLVKDQPKTGALRVGITGPPGAGKSTIVSGLIKEYRAQKKTVGVLAVDPSSPFSKGAILGDRIRYSEHFNDPKVFIRSLGSRGAMGGISGSVYLMARAFDHWNFDVLIIETVGVGQTEFEVMNVADIVGVVVVPEFGDAIQALKAGILEVANVFVVNKADRPGAESIAKELELWAGQEKKIPVLQTVAKDHKGIKELADFLIKNGKPDRASLWKLRAEADALARLHFSEIVAGKLAAASSAKEVLIILEKLLDS
jgi:LAO/AO transport system kinase